MYIFKINWKFSFSDTWHRIHRHKLLYNIKEFLNIQYKFNSIDYQLIIIFFLNVIIICVPG